MAEGDDPDLAHHEAGHAVAAHVIGVRVVFATIDGARTPGGIGRGCVTTSPSVDSWASGDDDRLRKAAVFHLAGPEAERRLAAIPSHQGRSGWALDEFHAACAERARDAGSYDGAVADAQLLVAQRWTAIERVAAALITARTLEGDGLLAVLVAALPEREEDRR